MRFSMLVVLLSFLPVSQPLQDGKATSLQTATVQEIQDADVPKVTPEKPMDFWMKHKLDHSKTLLESLTMGEFEKLANTAGQMRLLGRIEELVRSRNAEYQTQVKKFDRSLLALIRHANEQDTAGATQAFNQMTTSCVGCHTLLRKGVEIKPQN